MWDFRNNYGSCSLLKIILIKSIFNNFKHLQYDAMLWRNVLISEEEMSDLVSVLLSYSF